jgi:hypothetical protein
MIEKQTQSLEDKFDELQERALKQISGKLVADGVESNAYTAQLTAEQMMEGRCNEAAELYEGMLTDTEGVPLTEGQRTELLRQLAAAMELRFSQGGYIEGLTAKRLAATFMRLLEEDGWKEWPRE